MQCRIKTGILLYCTSEVFINLYVSNQRCPGYYVRSIVSIFMFQTSAVRDTTSEAFYQSLCSKPALSGILRQKHVIYIYVSNQRCPGYYVRSILFIFTFQTSAVRDTTSEHCINPYVSNQRCPEYS